MVIEFALYGRWDDLDEINSAFKLLNRLYEVAGGSYVVNDLNLPSDAPGNLADDQGNPFEGFASYKRMYIPLGLSGVYTIYGIDTAANSYPGPTTVSVNVQGVPGTIEVTPSMSPFDIMVAAVAWSDAEFDGFPHHCWFEGLDIDTEAHTLKFSMGS